MSHKDDFPLFSTHLMINSFQVDVNMLLAVAMPFADHMIVGFQRLVLYLDGVITVEPSQGSLPESRAYIHSRRSYYEPWLTQVLAIQSYAGPKRPFPHCHNHNNYHILHGKGNGSIGVHKICRS